MGERGHTAALVASLALVAAVLTWLVTGPAGPSCGHFEYSPLAKDTPISSLPGCLTAD